MTAMDVPPDLADARMHERLALRLARDIVAGRMPDGTAFPTGDELTRIHGVSRTVAREALQALQAAGLVHVQHGKRTLVGGVADWRFLDVLVQRAMQSEPPPERLVRDLYEARLCIEVEAARLCAIRCSDGTIETLRVVLDSTADLVARAVLDGAPQGNPVVLDRTFHGAIADGSGNVVLARMARDAHRGLLTAWPTIDRDRLTAIDAQHREIALQIERRNPAAAADAMRRHVEWSLEDVETTMRDSAVSADRS